MTELREKHAVDAALPITAIELMVLAVMNGVALGTAYASFDFLHRAPGLAPADLLVAVALASGPAIAVTVGVVAVLLLVFKVRGTSPTRLGWTALLAGGDVVALGGSVVLMGTTNYRDWVGMCLIVASVLLGVVVHALVGRAGRLAEKGRPGVMTLAIVQSMVLAIGGLAAVKAWHLPVLLGAMPLAAAVTLLVVSARRVAISPTRTASALLIGLLITVGVFTAVGAPQYPDGPKLVERTGARPNVVLVVLDTLRRDRLGCYGHTGGLTPELDRIAAEGVVYEQAISAAPWTVPSHASMFTGLFPVSHGCSYANHLWLDDAFLTLAESLKAFDFQTVALNGNVAMVENNLFQGFDQCVWLDGPYDALSVFGFARVLGSPVHWADKGGWEAGQELGAWLGAAYDKDAPAFLFVNLYETHDPYLPPIAQRRAHLPGDTGIVTATRVGARTKPTQLHIAGTVDPEAQPIVSGLYDASVAYQDVRLGELMTQLRASIDLDNTLLIVTADHGENLGEAGRWGHLQAINDALIHVPLIIRFPSKFPAGTRVTGLCQTTDIPATVFDVLGLECPLPGASTRSLVPNQFAPAEHAYAQVAPFYGLLDTVDRTLGFRASDSRFRADRRVIRTESLKYVWSSDGNHQLYDLAHDPLETDNQADRLSDAVKTLDDQLAAWWLAQPAYVREERTDSTASPLDEKTLERLRSLGYVGD